MLIVIKSGLSTILKASVNNFSNILFVLNPNQEDSSILDWLLNLARQHQARLTVMDVIIESELPGSL